MLWSFVAKENVFNFLFENIFAASFIIEVFCHFLKNLQNLGVFINKYNL